MSFVVKLTTLHRADEPAVDLATLTQYSDLSVRRVINDVSEARVTISMYDAAAVHCTPFAFALKVNYNDECVFWGRANAEDNFGAGTVTISAGDVEILRHHYVRIGDPILDITDPDTGLTDEGLIQPDSSGISLLIDCAQNLDDQDDAGWPVLGIRPRTLADSGSTSPLGVERGMEVFDTISTIIGAQTGPDIEFLPVDSGDYDGNPVYCTWVAFDEIVDDQRETIIFTYNVTGQPDNLADVQVSPKFPQSVVHVLDQPPLHRETAVNGPAAASVGAWVRWQAADVKVRDDDTSVLQLLADSIAAVYGVPLRSAQITLRPDAGQTHFYGHTHDFTVGTIVTVGATKGNRAFLGVSQITEVELKQDGPRGLATTVLQTVPWVDDVPDGG
jgi:hypothetical protein